MRGEAQAMDRFFYARREILVEVSKAARRALARAVGPPPTIAFRPAMGTVSTQYTLSCLDASMDGCGYGYPYGGVVKM